MRYAYREVRDAMAFRYVMSVVHSGMYGNPRLDASKAFDVESEAVRDAYNLVSYRMPTGPSENETLARVYNLVKSSLSGEDISAEYGKIAARLARSGVDPAHEMAARAAAQAREAGATGRETGP